MWIMMTTMIIFVQKDVIASSVVQYPSDDDLNDEDPSIDNFYL